MTDWAAFARELDAWAGVPGGATFWWRDDDLSRPGPAIDRLLALSDAYAAPLLLAVIPARLAGDLSALAADRPHIWFAQHGFAHEDHGGPAPAGKRRRKIELGGVRPSDRIAVDLTAGWTRLAACFGDRLLAVMVPPWNRIAPAAAAALPDLGYCGWSGFGPRGRDAGPGIVVNTHIDVIDWRGTRGFAGEAAVLAQAIAHLSARRAGAVDRSEPTGLLTHHADHDPATWAFIAGFLETVTAHRHARILAPPDVFAAGPRDR